MAESESSEALKVKEKEPKRQENGRNDSNLEAEEEEFEEDDGEEEEEEEEEEEAEESQPHELQQLGELQEKEVRGSEVETVAAVALPPSSTAMVSKENVQSVGNSGMEKHVETEFKEQVEGSHQEVVASVAAQTKAETQNHLHSYVCPTTLSELSPTSVTQSISSALSPTLPEERMSSPKVKNAGQQSSAELKPLCVPVVKTSIPDGYNWRKYGQKQVKSPKGSRSYYKCTYSDCYAKKIECSDHSGHVIEIVNKGMHSHDPPWKNKSTRETRDASAVRPVLQTTVTEHTVRMLKDSEPATLSKEPRQEATAISERKRQNSSSSDENMEIQIEDHASEPEPKRRLKTGNLECSKTPIKPGKKPKFVVHAAGDVGISGDGFRWRKYGQKMVKGNPHPRNYYRCTSAGCPVRKHIEIAADNTNAVIITYKGVHDHDMPVPKKRHGQPSAPLVAAAAPASMTSMPLKKTDTFQNQVISTQWSVSKEGELTSETLDLGVEKEKAIESARTLLSIGFEIKPC